jgi:hypothetical protein
VQIAFPCDNCQRIERVSIDTNDGGFQCPRCRQAISFAGEAPRGARLDRCLICGCGELFIRKDFSQRLGISIVATGFLLSSIAWGFHLIHLTYAILFATALIDVCLYLTVGNLLQCYRCSATYRGLDDLAAHGAFSLETHERFRQQAARLR